MVRFHEVRERCRVEARRFHYPEHLFGRFPTYIFRYFMSVDPLHSTGSYSLINIITVFMLINNIDAGLMMAFFNAGDQGLDTLFQLHGIFSVYWRLYRSTPENELISIFGDCFSFHCESRTLRRVDMSIANSEPQNHEHFVPDTSNWRRWREVRRLIRIGEFRVIDDYDLLEVREAMRGGMRGRGRRHRQ